MTDAKKILINKLYSEDGDPFFGFDYKESDTDLHELFEWGSREPMLIDSLDKSNARFVVECGSWKGGSAIAMALRMKEKRVDGVVACIDTWLACELLHHHHGVRPALKIKHGRPEMWRSFYANVFYYGVEDYILPIHKPTISGFRLLNGKNRNGYSFAGMFDMAYIDASHVTPMVYIDAVEAWDCLRVGGHMVFDDVIQNQKTNQYEASDFRGVYADLVRFAAERDLEIEYDGTKARVIKK